MATITGHYKRLSRTFQTEHGTFTADDGGFPEALVTVKGASKPLDSFIRYATKVLADRGEWCDTDDDGDPVPCAEQVDYPSGSTRRGDYLRPHINRVFRIRGLSEAVAAVCEHSAVLAVEAVFCADARPPRTGTGQASGDVSAIVKRAMRSRDRRDREILRTDPVAREAVAERDTAAFADAAPDREVESERKAMHQRGSDEPPPAFALNAAWSKVVPMPTVTPSGVVRYHSVKVVEYAGRVSRVSVQSRTEYL